MIVKNKITVHIISIISIAVLFAGAGEAVFGQASLNNVKQVKKKRQTAQRPYLLMVTSMDDRISTMPFADMKKENIEIFNDSPFDGIALNLMDIYSAQTLPDENNLCKKAKELKAAAQKDVWIRVNLNRIYQRNKKNCYYDENAVLEKLSEESSFKRSNIRKLSTPYFKRIKCVDLYNEAGALKDFYKIFELSLKISKELSSGIVLDFEDYHCGKDAYDIFKIAKAQNKTVDDIITQLIKIGVHMADTAAKENPNVTIISFFTGLQRMKYNGANDACLPAYSYIAQGMLMRAKEKNIPLVLVEGGELELNYV
ncbi:MAG: hypothetical protein PHV82_09470, partial [Victivallaceae bacterium]|nr:hypothetical protein [Victivallaceae bacterium]